MTVLGNYFIFKSIPSLSSDPHACAQVLRFSFYQIIRVVCSLRQLKRPYLIIYIYIMEVHVRVCNYGGYI